ncbi:RNA polymerase sigma factor [Actinomadura hibisca]|uniref:RNA polymerase sigma factor n=1 Tax=Actinomadura hibisca TaxID=68565 RepID=UPI000835FDD0|nr:sigma-70 family RNA polymerase sigma factor [Actinomadura hibisca]
MSGWPHLDHADDERLALSLAAGEAGALPQIVDRYAARLYDYCHALLRDQESAAGALHDALLAAAAHVALLREPVRFRAWLYTLVRNECLRRLRDPDRPTERREAPEVEDMFLDAGERARRLETRRLVHGALSGLNGREREALDLMSRHGLDAAEVAGVLGIDAQEATDLTGEAQRRLDDALAAALIARTGRDGCPEVAALADGGDGPLTPPVVRRLVRHIESCRTCTERRDRTVSTARLLQVLPVALMPPELRNEILQDAADPGAAELREWIADRAEPFDTWGWPVPVDGAAAVPEKRRRSAPPRLWPALAAAAAVILVVTAAFMLMPDGGTERTSAQRPPGTVSAPDPTESSDDTEPPEPSESPSPTPSESPSPTPTTSSPVPTPSRKPTTRPTTRAPRTPEREPAQGTLAVSGCTINAPARSCGVTVTAVGGPVDWRVIGAAGVGAAGGGTLAAGRSATVTATRSGACDGEGGSGTVSFAPGGSAAVFWTCADGGGGDGPPDGDQRPVR